VTVVARASRPCFIGAAAVDEMDGMDVARAFCRGFGSKNKMPKAHGAANCRFRSFWHRIGSGSL